ncbi:T3SS secreted effector NleI/NleG [Escherichia coli]|uniref:hypothetical protein n=1 Tax=Escherichia coli TaxID=562 RepID=UPI0010B6D34A|nr:hypothetical protein [Escherichia coli]GCJ67147.1 T3SS secreted effector NleI/NleG [Escherichia coli]
MLLTSAIASNSFSTGMQVLRAQMAASGGGEITVGGQTVRMRIFMKGDHSITSIEIG